MAMSDVSRDFGAPSLANQQFEGYVISTADDQKRQRVRIRIPVLHRGIPDEDLPYANALNNGPANAGAGVGQVMVPDQYAKVVISFPTDDPHFPQYSASPTSDDVNKDNELLGEDYPNTYGHTDSYGNRISVNRATGDMTFAHHSGAILHIDGGGNITLAAAGDLNLAAKNNINISAGGRVKVSGGGDILLDGSNVMLNSGSATPPVIPGQRTTPVITNQSGKTNL